VAGFGPPGTGYRAQMSRYLCNDPSHRRGDEQRPVDVTSQVRLERALVPRAPAVLAHTERVVEAVRNLDFTWSTERRTGEIQRLLAGETRLTDAPVVLVSEHSVMRPTGLYEMDELRLAEPLVDRLAGIAVDGANELVVLEDRDTSDRGEAGRHAATDGQATQTQRRTQVVPQGVFPLVDLSLRLANAGRQEDDIVAAIRETPSVGAEGAQRARPIEPWRVVITCPEAEGVPPVSHRTVFTGSGDVEPSVMIGTPANGFDVALETSAEVDLEPATAVATLERRLKVLLFAETAIAGLGLLFAWVAGSLGLAAREAPGWLGFAVLLALGALTLAAVPLFAGNRTHGNADDTFELRRYYRSRLELLSLAPAISAGMFALALLCGWIAPALAADDPLPPVSITFDTTSEPVTARIFMAGRDLATDETLHAEMRSFTSADDAGTLAGRLTTTGDPSGEVPLTETVSLGSDARYLSVQTWTGDLDDDTADTVPPSCTPSSPTGTGCTVVAVPTGSEIQG